MKSFILRNAFIAIFLLTLSSMVIAQTTWYVPDDFPGGIQDAINASASGDTIIVRPGTYVENIDFSGKAITVKSEEGPLFTTIDGNQTGSVVTFNSDEGSDSVLEGFTITNGSGTEISYYNLVNVYNGGGLFCYGSCSPKIINNIIRDNEAQRGAGISCLDYSSPIIESNIICQNTASSHPQGQGGRGGGIHSYIADPEVKNNLIINNYVTLVGGGIYVDSGDKIDIDVKIEFCTISGNFAESVGDGILISKSVTPAAYIKNSIVWENGDSEINNSGTGVPEVTYCCIKGGWPGEGNIDADPLFVPGPWSEYDDDYDDCKWGEFYLSQVAAGQAEDSPCVDAGDHDNEVIPGITRTDHVQDEWPVDMGFHYPLELPGIEATIDLKPDTLNLKNKGKYVTCYIELPEGYDVNEIDVSTVYLEGIIQANDHPTSVGDYDKDDIPDLMVKFDRKLLIQYLIGLNLDLPTQVELKVTGDFSSIFSFEGNDTIRIINPPMMVKK